MTQPGPPAAPTELVLDPIDAKTQLRTRVIEVLRGLPAYFEFKNTISGVNATDLFSLNTLLGAAIEGQVVRALNQQRGLWDPRDEWLGYTFERQSQAFPDVRLARRGSSDQIVLGIELKGWWMLSKEGEPSFRFTTTPAACADHDLLVVVPWYLDNVLSGQPTSAEPYVVSARWAAEYRNYYWQHMRATAPTVNKDINAPAGAAPYPMKVDNVADVPAYDGGGNFGRVARVKGLMTDWINSTNEFEILGIRVSDWMTFLRSHSDKADPDTVTLELARALMTKLGPGSNDKAIEVLHLLTQLAELLKE